MFEEIGLLFNVINGYILKQDDGQVVVLRTADSLKFPFSDFKKAAMCPFDQFEDEQNVVAVSPKIYVVAGYHEDIKAIRDYFQEQIDNFFLDLQDGPEIHEYLDEKINEIGKVISTDLLLLLFLKELTNGIKRYTNERELKIGDMSVLCYFTTEKETDSITIECVNRVIVFWLEYDNIRLRGYQCVTRTFFTEEYITGRRVIATNRDPHTGTWRLVMEGGLVVPLVEKFDEGIKIPNGDDLGYFTSWGVGEIINNPIYAYGYWFEPYDLFLEWQFVLQYSLAILPVKNFSLKKLGSLYEDFCELIGMSVCYSQILEKRLTFIGKPMFLRGFIKHIQEVRAILHGKEEIGFSKNVMHIMRSRYAYLPTIHRFLERYFPNEMKDLFEFQSFDERVWRSLLQRARNEADSYKKGLLFEKVAEYFFSTIPGLKTSPRRQRSKLEEVDLYCFNVSYDPELWKLGALFLVECKNRNDKLQSSEVRRLIPIMDAKGIKTAILFSYSGFTSAALDQIENLQANGMNFILFDNADFDRLLKDKYPLHLLNEKIGELEAKRNRLGEYGFGR